MKPALLFLIALAFIPLASANAPSEGFAVFSPDSDLPWGFDYVEGVTDCDGTGPFAQFQECAVFVSQADDFSYAAKDLPGTKDAYEVWAEFGYPGGTSVGGGDGITSGFAIVFSFTENDAITQANGLGEKGDGKTTGAFHNSVKARFKEDGDKWEVQLREVVNGVEGTLQTFPVPGDDHEVNEYGLRVDTEAGTLALMDATRGVIKEVEIDGSFGTIESQWFVGFGFSDFANSRVILKTDGISGAIYDVDPVAPEISDFTYTPSGALAAGEAVTLSATVVDDWDATPTVVGVYTINGGAESTVAATKSGTTYTATIPGAAAGQDMRVWLRATDSNGLEAESAKVAWSVGSGEGPAVEQPAPTGGGGVGDDAVKDQDFLLMAGLAFIAGLGVFILLRRQAKKLAVVILVLGVAGAALLLMAWQGVVLHPAYLLALPLAYGAYVVVRK